MGESKNRKKNLFMQNPNCIFCGGHSLATTSEHCPPRAMFQNRSWPEGFEFAACDPCNRGTADEDVLVAMLARMNPFDPAADADGKTHGLMVNANQHHAGLFAQMDMTTRETRQAARQIGFRAKPGLTIRESGLVNVPDRLGAAVRVLASKLTKAIYYMETGMIFPHGGGILFQWYTNVQLFKYGEYPVLEKIAVFNAPTPVLRRNGKDLSDQFDYRFSVSDDRTLACLRAKFGKSFAFLSFACPDRRRLEQMLDDVKAASGKDRGPLEFI